MFGGLEQGIKRGKAEVVVCPPFVYLQEAIVQFKSSAIKVGGQDCFWEQEGAFTGQVSAKMLKSLGAGFVILGHSEKVALGETPEITNQKIKASLEAGLRPIICLGETELERKAGRTFQVLEQKLQAILKGLRKSDIAKLLIAYEPVWAIGTGNNCSADDALTMALFIKKLVLSWAGQQASQQIKILYGGSVDSRNASNYLQHPVLAGLLVGGASLNIKEFTRLVKNAIE